MHVEIICEAAFAIAMCGVKTLVRHAMWKTSVKQWARTIYAALEVQHLLYQPTPDRLEGRLSHTSLKFRGIRLQHVILPTCQA